MTTKKVNGNNFREMLEYVLEDFLELRASLEKEETQPLKDFLFAQDLDHQTISAVDGLEWGRQLVLIKQADPNFFRHLVFVSPSDGRIRVRRLT